MGVLLKRLGWRVLVALVVVNIAATAYAQTPSGESISWLDYFREFGAIATLLFGMVAWFRGWLYGAPAVAKLEKAWADRYDDKAQECDRWMNLALENTTLLHKTIDTVDGTSGPAR